jgi:hypothetical protein
MALALARAVELGREAMTRAPDPLCCKPVEHGYREITARADPRVERSTG